MIRAASEWIRSADETLVAFAVLIEKLGQMNVAAGNEGPVWRALDPAARTAILVHFAKLLMR